MQCKMKILDKCLLVIGLLCAVVNARPQTAFVSVPTTVPTTTKTLIIHDEYEDLYPEKAAKKKLEEDNAKTIIQHFHVTSNIQYRYALTTIEAYMKNPSSKAREVTFSMVLPDTAFVSNFSMILHDDQEFVAKVEAKKKAADIYQDAIKSNSAAGLVQQDVRNVNQILVSVNVEARGKARFRLTYEELLQRQLSKYQHVIHVNLDQVVNDLKVQVNINESLPVVRIRVPELKTDPNAIEMSLRENPFAVVEKSIGGDPAKAQITFQPDVAAQKKMLENQDSKDGIHGQFIVEYDVDRKDRENDVQVLDGYFVHFFSPESLTTLPKHVVFVIDISGSMWGEKMQQTKDAMVTILDDLSDKDHFNILTFSDGVTPWVPQAEKLSEAPHSITHKGTKELREEALRYVLKLQPQGGTNIHGAMIDALNLVTDVLHAETAVPKNTKSLIVFLTDGEPTTGITSGSEIQKLIERANEKLEVPIYGLAFGRGADFPLIKSISLKSGAFARKIFEGSDAAIQLEDFYRELANPLLNNVKFEYVGEAFDNNSITKTDFKTYFKGSEYVIAGKISNDIENQDVEIVVGAEGDSGAYSKRFNLCFLRPLPLPADFNLNGGSVDVMEPETLPSHPGFSDRNCILPPKIPRPEPSRSKANFIERLWAFLSIKNLLDDKMSAKEKRIEQLSEPEETETTTTENIEDELYDVKEPVPLPVTVLPNPAKKNRTERALELALRYNFVTKLTSLVVRRTIELEGESLATFEKSEIKIEPRPLLDTPQFEVRQHYNYGHISSAGFGGSSFSKKGGLYASMPPSGRFSVGGLPPPPIPYHFRAPDLNFGLQMATTTYPSRVYGTTVDDFEEDDVSQDYDLNSMIIPYSESPPTTTTQGPCTGKISLFAQTYLRGLQVTTDSDVRDLSANNFDNLTTSVEVSGTCCWLLYTEPNFKGKSIQLKPGQFKSAADIGLLFREVSSVKNIGRC